MIQAVGTQNRSELIREPTEAWHRGGALDQMLAASWLPIKHGVIRTHHHVFNKIHDLRKLEQAHLLSGSRITVIQLSR